MKIDSQKLPITLLLILAVEIISFFGYIWPKINTVAFLVIIFSLLIIALYRFEYAFLILLAELFIGSKGYLFYFNYQGVDISVRIAIWLIVMSVWLAKMIVAYFRGESKPSFSNFKKAPASLLVLLVIFIAWGVINGLARQNEFSALFFDFNGWLYFLTILPATYLLKTEDNFNRLLLLFLAATIWLSIKTLFLFFIFSHDLPALSYSLYKWVRTSGVGEVTQVQGGFYRIFFQSHIYVLIAYLASLAILAYRFLRQPFSRGNNKKNLYCLIALNILFFITVLISFSRSFWLALAAGYLLLLFCLALIIKGGGGALAKILKNLSLNLSYFFLTALASLMIIAAILQFPFPEPLGGFETAHLFSARASETEEAAIASRWELLGPLWSEIKKEPVGGQGFGASLTYRSKDPRILASPSQGIFTTYAFEWGWLDIWLKVGLFGLLAYLLLLSDLFYRLLLLAKRRPEQSIIFNILALTIVVLALINFFTPYLNHPLGIGLIIIIFSRLKIATIAKI